MVNRERLGLIGLLSLVVITLFARCSIHEQPSPEPFALEGAHADIACSDCHTQGFDAAPPRTCTGCHEAELPAPHWLDECDECHSQERWDDLDYEHEEWPLTGGHIDIECVECHEGEGDDWDAPDACIVCHDEDAPEGHMIWACEDCHTTVSWDDLTYTHGFFPLDGGHSGLRCEDCHEDGYHDTPDECIDCHEDDAPVNHPHGDCGLCHTIYSWEEHTFEHTSFPLEGAHANLACEDCHPNGYSPAPANQCADCHASSIPSGHPDWDCAECHQTTTWSDVTFDHSFFPLVGGHAGQDCAECHAAGYNNTPDACNDCHADDSPHTIFNTCEWCHDVWGW